MTRPETREKDARRRWLPWLALVVPPGDRDVWRREWTAELAYADSHDTPSGTSAPRRSRGRVLAAVRHALWLRWHQRRVETIARDARHAIRVLVRHPAYTITAVLTLALGIGANTVIFSTVRAVLLRPLPFPAADRLAFVTSTTTKEPDVVAMGTVSPPDFADWRRDTSSFVAMAAIADGSFALIGVAAAEQLLGAEVTGDFFAVLGSRAAQGRTLGPDDALAGAPEAVVLNHALWLRKFGGDVTIVGRRVVLDGVSREVAGVMPAGFQFPLGADLWVPKRFTADDLATQRGAHYLSVIGRLRPGVTITAAREELRGLGTQLSAAHPKNNANSSISLAPLRSAIVDDVRPALRLLLAAVGLVLLVACVNVAALVLGFSIGRQHDLSLRAALGASRRELVRSLLIESFVLGGAGGAVGLALAAWGVRLIATANIADVPLLGETRIDLVVLAFTAVVSILAALASGVVPAWFASRTDLVASLRGGGPRATGDRQRRRVRAALLTAEIALAVALLAGAGQLGRAFMGLIHTNLGFNAQSVQTFSFALPKSTYPDPALRAVFMDELLGRIRTRPAVVAAGAVFGLPLTGLNYYLSAFERDGHRLETSDANRLTMQLRVVTPGYFATMGIHRSRGREFRGADARGAPSVTMLSESAARQLWPDADAIGRTITVGSKLGLGGDRAGGEVIGIVDDVRDGGPAATTRPTIYVAYAQFPMDFASIAVKTSGDPAALVPMIRSEVAALDGNLPIFGVKTMADLGASSVAQPRFYLLLLGLFAGAAVLLAAVGVYGAVSQLVGSRTREIGIRLALGSTRQGVVGLVVGYTGKLALAGVAAGLLLSLAGGRLLARLPFGVPATDALTFGLVAVAAIGVALLASALPARRAARVDPLMTLRSD